MNGQRQRSASIMQTHERLTVHTFDQSTVYYIKMYNCSHEMVQTKLTCM